MRTRCLVSVFCVMLSLVFFGCSGTKFNIRTDPTDATVKVYSETGLKDKVQSDIEYEVKNEDDFFVDTTGYDRSSVYVGLEIAKEGYRPKFFSHKIRKGAKTRENSPSFPVRLEKLDTEIVIEGDPAGAKIRFYKNLAGARRADSAQQVDIPPEEFLDGAEEAIFKSMFEKYVVTSQVRINNRIVSYVLAPWNVFFSSYTFEKFKDIKWVRIDKEGYIPDFMEFDVLEGESNHMSYKLRKMLTTLKVISSPEGVEVDDVYENTNLPGAGAPLPAQKRRNEFGYLGKTPFIRTFSWEDCESRPEILNTLKIRLTLRCTKEGYFDEFRKVEIPLGEEMTVKVELQPRSAQITFQTDPTGAHVYLTRVEQKQIWNEKKGAIDTQPVNYLKHLGTTPFTYYMDPADTLSHGDLIIYRKSGYRDANDKFVQGLNHYHMVLTPTNVKER